MIKTQKETVGLNEGARGGGTKDSPRGSLAVPRDTRPTLADAGIDKKLSSRSQAGRSNKIYETTLADTGEPSRPCRRINADYALEVALNTLRGRYKEMKDEHREDEMRALCLRLAQWIDSLLCEMKGIPHDSSNN